MALLGVVAALFVGAVSVQPQSLDAPAGSYGTLVAWPWHEDGTRLRIGAAAQSAAGIRGEAEVGTVQSLLALETPLPSQLMPNLVLGLSAQTLSDMTNARTRAPGSLQLRARWLPGGLERRAVAFGLRLEAGYGLDLRDDAPGQGSSQNLVGLTLGGALGPAAWALEAGSTLAWRAGQGPNAGGTGAYFVGGGLALAPARSELMLSLEARTRMLSEDTSVRSTIVALAGRFPLFASLSIQLATTLTMENDRRVPGVMLAIGGRVGAGDSDRDALLDSEDACPADPGTSASFGCPDLDDDGDKVINLIDACVEVAGPASNGGCPNTDRDKNGVPDVDDKS